jgi:glucose/arabinose dehydrogenase
MGWCEPRRSAEVRIPFAAILSALALVSGDAGASTTPLALKLVARTTTPSYATSAPGDRLYVATRNGVVRGLEGSVFVGHPLLDLRGRVSQRGERGLLSIVFDPGYERNGFLYAAYTDLAGSLVVARFHVHEGRAALATEKRLLRVARPRDHLYHYGGQLEFGPDDRLYVSTGDGGYSNAPNAPRRCLPGSRGGRRVVICTNLAIDVGHAQDLHTLFGKILRLSAGGRATVVAYGLRNPWRFSFDRATGALYIGDVGFDKYEEVDYAPRLGARLLNFGWSYYAGLARQDHGAKALNPAGRLVQPIYVYDHHRHDCSVIGGYVYRGTGVSALRGRYVFGDWCTGRIWSLRVVGGRATDVRLEPVRAPLLVSFGEDARGELYALTLDGAVYRLSSS